MLSRARRRFLSLSWQLGRRTCTHMSPPCSALGMPPHLQRRHRQEQRQGCAAQPPAQPVPCPREPIQGQRLPVKCNSTWTTRRARSCSPMHRLFFDFVFTNPHHPFSSLPHLTTNTLHTPHVCHSVRAHTHTAQIFCYNGSALISEKICFMNSRKRTFLPPSAQPPPPPHSTRHVGTSWIWSGRGGPCRTEAAPGGRCAASLASLA